MRTNFDRDPCLDIVFRNSTIKWPPAQCVPLPLSRMVCKSSIYTYIMHYLDVRISRGFFQLSNAVKPSEAEFLTSSVEANWE
jgi:hypothetical protein